MSIYSADSTSLNPTMDYILQLPVKTAYDIMCDFIYPLGTTTEPLEKKPEQSDAIMLSEVRRIYQMFFNSSRFLEIDETNINSYVLLSLIDLANSKTVSSATYRARIKKASFTPDVQVLLQDAFFSLCLYMQSLSDTTKFVLELHFLPDNKTIRYAVIKFCKQGSESLADFEPLIIRGAALQWLLPKLSHNKKPVTLASISPLISDKHTASIVVNLTKLTDIYVLPLGQIYIDWYNRTHKSSGDQIIMCYFVNNNRAMHLEKHRVLCPVLPLRYWSYSTLKEAGVGAKAWAFTQVRTETKIGNYLSSQSFKLKIPDISKVDKNKTSAALSYLPPLIPLNGGVISPDYQLINKNLPAEPFSSHISISTADAIAVKFGINFKKLLSDYFNYFSLKHAGNLNHYDFGEPRFTLVAISPNFSYFRAIYSDVVLDAVHVSSLSYKLSSKFAVLLTHKSHDVKTAFTNLLDWACCVYSFLINTILELHPYYMLEQVASILEHETEITTYAFNNDITVAVDGISLKFTVTNNVVTHYEDCMPLFVSNLKMQYVDVSHAMPSHNSLDKDAKLAYPIIAL